MAADERAEVCVCGDIDGQNGKEAGARCVWDGQGTAGRGFVRSAGWGSFRGSNDCHY